VRRGRWGSLMDEPEPPLVVGGLYELIHGVSSLAESIAWWKRFGFGVGPTGSMTADESFRAYGVRSAMKSARLLHGVSDHGLIRVIEWEAPTGPGCGPIPLRALGSRWGAMLNTNLLSVQNHCEQADVANQQQYWLPSVRQDPAGPTGEPFLDDGIHVREMALCRKETRQVFFQRFGYSNPSYGAVAVDAAFPTSQVTHAGIVTAGDPETAGVFFYQRALGLLMTREASVSGYADVASRRLFELQEHESYRCWDFDDPTSAAEPAKWKSGRLKFIHFDDFPVADVRSKTRLGALGLTAYSWRVRDVEAAATSCEQNGGTTLSRGSDEFGHMAVRVLAPDGHDLLLTNV
jgi:hypothetical protein